MKHPADELLAYLHGELAEARRREVAQHLDSCAECRVELEAFRSAELGVRSLPRQDAPGDMWARIERALEPRPKQRRAWLPALAFAGAAAAVALGIWIWQGRSGEMLSGPFVAVTADSGKPVIGSLAVDGQGKLHIGEELRTGAGDSATVTMEGVGKVKVMPNSRVALLKSVQGEQGEQRFDLRQGSISAEITTRPKIFFVETPLATAVDLGCKYTLTVDEHGNGKLKVTEGWVELVGKKHKAMVRAGSECEITRVQGPGVPHRSEASAGLVSAVKTCQGGDWTALPQVLSEAKEPDALTLWHLLSRAEGSNLVQVYNALVRLAPPPAGVTKSGCLNLDRPTLEKWREDFAPLSSYDFWKP